MFTLFVFETLTVSAYKSTEIQLSVDLNQRNLNEELTEVRQWKINENRCYKIKTPISRLADRDFVNNMEWMYSRPTEYLMLKGK